jgi:hypothetical protein
MRRAATIGLIACLVSSTGCATPLTPAPAGAPELARSAPSYSASLRVSLKSASLRARTRAFVAFRRPDALRVEIPGPVGPRLVAVARAGRLTAVFPGDHAVFTSEASADAFASLLGIALEPSEIMDLLVGTPSRKLRAYRAGWGPERPNAIEATLPDGGHLYLTVEDAGLGPELGSMAFDPPPSEGFHAVTAVEARKLWSAR